MTAAWTCPRHDSHRDAASDASSATQHVTHPVQTDIQSQVGLRSLRSCRPAPLPSPPRAVVPESPVSSRRHVSRCEDNVSLREPRALSPPAQAVETQRWRIQGRGGALGGGRWSNGRAVGGMGGGEGADSRSSRDSGTPLVSIS